jgi:hypothetical protein
MHSKRDLELAKTLAALPPRRTGELDRADPRSYEQETGANEIRIGFLRRQIQEGALANPAGPLDPEAQQFLGHGSLLSTAIDRDDWHAARALLEAGVPATDIDAFHQIAWRNGAVYVELLRSHNADFSAATENGDNILHFAAGEDNNAVFQAARRAAPGAMFAKNGFGRTPFEMWRDGGGMTDFSRAVWTCLDEGALGVNYPIHGCPAYVFLYEAMHAKWTSDKDRGAVRDLLERFGQAELLDLHPGGHHVAAVAQKNAPWLDKELAIVTGECLADKLHALAAKHERAALARVAEQVRAPGSGGDEKEGRGPRRV